MQIQLIKPDRLKFSLGRLTATPAALQYLTNEDTMSALRRHVVGDWGEVDSEDKAANDRALIEGTRLLSVYSTAAGVKFWIITEADRSATTILLPEDY
jgi:hypothetical protein